MNFLYVPFVAVAFLLLVAAGGCEKAQKPAPCTCKECKCCGGCSGQK